MTIQRSQGALRPQVSPLDELPATAAVAPAPVPRRSNGTLDGKAAGKALGRLGGEATATRARLVLAIGLADTPPGSDFRPYRNAADDWVRRHQEDLALQSGGIVGAGAMSIVATAGMQLAASRYFGDKAAAAGDAKLMHLASTLGNDSRQNLLAAFELGIREQRARIQSTSDSEDKPWFQKTKQTDDKKEGNE